MAIFSTAIIENGGLRYRIEKRPTPFATWQQRMIFYPSEGAPYLSDISYEDWIDTPSKELGVGFSLVEEVEER